jgi:hypothetical protein
MSFMGPRLAVLGNLDLLNKSTIFFAASGIRSLAGHYFVERRARSKISPSIEFKTLGLRWLAVT